MKINIYNLERAMQVAHDLKKNFTYDKGQGVWYWFDRDEVDNPDGRVGPFATFLAALDDVCEPYTRGNGF